MSMNARRTRTLRGVGAAVFASFTALASHIIAGGSAPNVFGMTVVIALSVFVCVLLARSSLSLWRLSASVIASQAMFHWMFSVLGHGPNMRQEPSSIAADSLASGHHMMHSMPDSAMMPSGHAGMDHSLTSPTMLASHLLAAMLTIAVIYRFETILANINQLIRLIWSLIVAIVSIPVVFTGIARVDRACAQPRVVGSQNVDRSPVLRRGPPVFAL
ncbi:MAG: hypothetical protein L0G72_11115 [Brevibacterium aurantiacum]|nr:hypothetical protein [Brevibacterium aurantiacum]